MKSWLQRKRVLSLEAQARKALTHPGLSCSLPLPPFCQGLQSKPQRAQCGKGTLCYSWTKRATWQKTGSWRKAMQDCLGSYLDELARKGIWGQTAE